MNGNENSNNFSETVDNNIPEGIEYDIFSENTAEDLTKAESMNRDYLKHIYKEDMNFLNKEVRMTRTQYLQDHSRIEETFKKGKKYFKRIIIIQSVVLVIAVIFGIWCYFEWRLCTDIYSGVYSAVAYQKPGFSSTDSLGWWALSTMYGCLGWIASVLGIGQFLFFGYGYYKKIKHLERYKRIALETLELRKKEAMLLGHYDSLK